MVYSCIMRVKGPYEGPMVTLDPSPQKKERPNHGPLIVFPGSRGPLSGFAGKVCSGLQSIE